MYESDAKITSLLVIKWLYLTYKWKTESKVISAYCCKDHWLLLQFILNSSKYCYEYHITDFFKRT
jgi:hypothetical protein